MKILFLICLFLTFTAQASFIDPEEEGLNGVDAPLIWIPISADTYAYLYFSNNPSLVRGENQNFIELPTPQQNSSAPFSLLTLKLPLEV